MVAMVSLDTFFGVWARRLALVLLVLTAPTQGAAQQVITLADGAGDRQVAVGVDQAVVVQSASAFTDVSIAEPEVADIEVLSETSLYLFGRQRGRTSLTLIGPGNRLIANVTVIVEPEMSELKQRLAQLLPGEDIRVRSLGGGIVLSGAVSGAAQVDRAMALAEAYAGDDVTNLMTVGGTQQVSLKVRIAEISRTAAQQLGIGLGLADGGSTPRSAVSGGVQAAPNAPVGQIFSSGPQGGFGALDAVVSVTDSVLLNVAIDALESQGFARLLAEPTLVALSGGEADFLAGGEVPVPTVSDDGQVDVNYRSVGVSLAFQPTVLAQDQINIAVTSEVSNIDPTLGTTVGDQQLLGFSVRRATTTVELRDGQSFAIAGLYQDNFSDSLRQVPLLGDIPVLGALFRSAEFQRDESELVVLVTADLVAPTNTPARLRDPLRRLSIPNEAELFLFGRVTGADRTPPAFDGPYGYVLQ